MLYTIPDLHLTFDVTLEIDKFYSAQVPDRAYSESTTTEQERR